MTKKYFFSFLYFLLSVFVFSQEITFRTIEEESILKSGSIYSVLQDQKGFLWFGTEYGLYRYDGHEFVIYRNNPKDKFSISENNIWTLYEDSRGYIWAGTGNGGLNKFDPNSEKFIHWQSSENVTPVGTGLSDNGVTAITEDKFGNLWIGTYKGGLNRYDIATNQFYHWFKDSLNNKTLPVFYVTSLTIDAQNRLWIATFDGLFVTDIDSGKLKFQYWNVFTEKRSDPNQKMVWSLYESDHDSGKGLWLGTIEGLKYFEKRTGKTKTYLAAKVANNPFSNSYGSISEEIINRDRIFWLASYGGLLRFNLSTGIFSRYQHNESTPGSLSNNRVYDNLIDHSGVLWVATSSGINYQTTRHSYFEVWNQVSNDNKNLLIEVSSISGMPDGSMWIGASSGLYTIPDPVTSRKILKYKNFKDNEIWSLSSDAHNNLWIGTYGNGLYRLNIESGKTLHWKASSDKSGFPGNNYIKSTLSDSKGLIWLGLWGKGLNNFNPISGEWQHYQSELGNLNSLTYNDVWVVFEDRFGNIWIGTKGGGLNWFDRESELFINWQNLLSKEAQLSHNGILTIAEAIPLNISNDSLAALWIGTENGLNYFEYNPYSITINYVKNIDFNGLNRFPGNLIKGILDINDQLWISTNTGLVKADKDFLFKKERKSVNNIFEQSLNINHFTTNDGLPANDFSSGAVYRNKTGEIFWGNAGGLISFFPERVQKSGTITPTVITEINVNNKKQPDRLINNPDSVIHLEYNENAISFRFSALDYNAPKDCRFAYRLTGFEDDWVNAADKRYAGYTNLSPGKYIFEVKSTNSDGFWNQKSTTFAFYISPPWWNTTWAYFLYAFILFSIIIFIRRYELNRLRLRHQLEIQTFETKKFLELERVKSRFLTNLSHEFRTPLMLISGPVEQLRDQKDDGGKNETYDLILRNTNRLSNLIEQLLALSQLEAGVLSLHAEEKNVVPILKGLVFSFESHAQRKKVNLLFNSYEETIPVWIDLDKFEIIITNLISNAIKFTHEGGKVEVRIKSVSQEKQGSDHINIIISDTGIGIPYEYQERVFDRFFQVDDSSKRFYGGSGIGLALVKELIDLHHWNISLKSVPGNGSNFILMIPLGNTHLADDQIFQVASKGQFQDQDFINNIPTTILRENNTSGDSTVLPLILIVEDSVDVVIYLTNLLQKEFRIIDANNGNNGLKKAESEYPHLIISDVMMPGMDGLEFCRRIKTNLPTCHIPVILLTAKANIESKLEGLETGADDYLTKPFNYSELLIRIKNLLTQRKILREKYGKDLFVQPSNVTVNSLDSDFLEKAMEISKNNLSKPGFESEEFAKELFVSRSQLHRKLQAITGLPPGEFIRNMRIKRAAQLLLEKRLTVTQIAYEVGFNSPSHFTKAFKKQFKCLPSEFIEKSNI